MKPVITPFNPPMMNSAMKPSAKRIAVVITSRPCHSVASHANTCTALNIEMVMLAAAKKLIAVWLMPTANM